MRYLTGSIVDWNALLAQSFRCCKPGGYVESLESAPWMGSDDGTVVETSAMGQWGKLFVQGSHKLGRTFTIACDDGQRKAMEDAGFVDIQEFNMKVGIFLPQAQRLQWVQLLTGILMIGSHRRVAERSDTEGVGTFLTRHTRSGPRGLCYVHGQHGGLDEGRGHGLRCAPPSRNAEQRHTRLLPNEDCLG